jgi:RNA polymerase sigma factor (sigma-70 family)
MTVETPPESERPMTCDAFEDVWRREAPHVLAALLRRHHNFDDCEDAVQLALVAAAEQWPRQGLPTNPAGWLTRVASRRLIDQIRADAARRTREEIAAALDRAVPQSLSVADEDDPGDDNVLGLLILSAHPELSPSSQVALMLRAVGGLTTREIADAFFVPETTMAQRISRAKATLRNAGARFERPRPSTLAGRLLPVRHAISLIYTTGYSATDRKGVSSSTLGATALRLARDLGHTCPADPENAGLLALLLLTHARNATRFTADGELVPLAEQDRRAWDRQLVDEGIALVERTLPVGYVGPFQLQAAIAAVHAEADDAQSTDWPQILVLYEMLEQVDPTPAVVLGRAIATAEVQGPVAGLAVLEGVPETNHRVLAARGHMLARASRVDEARTEFLRAASLTRSIPEQRYLNQLAARVRPTSINVPGQNNWPSGR